MRRPTDNQRVRRAADSGWITQQKLIQEALERGVKLQRLLVLRGKETPWIRHQISAARNLGLPVVYTTPAGARRLVGRTPEQHIALERAPIAYLDDEQFAEVLQQWRHVVLLDRIQDPQNLGAVVRSSRALGADGLIISRDKAAGVTDSVVEVSRGAVLQLPVYRSGTMLKTVAVLRDAGFRVLAVTMQGDTRLSEVNWPERTVIVLGNEENGISRELLELAHERVSIPMPGGFESLNVSVAAGIVLYERVRAFNTDPGGV